MTSLTGNTVNIVVMHANGSSCCERKMRLGSRKSFRKMPNTFHFPHEVSVSNRAFLIIFENRKSWNRGIVNRMQHFLGMGRTGRVFHLFRLFPPQIVE